MNRNRYLVSTPFATKCAKLHLQIMNRFLSALVVFLSLVGVVVGEPVQKRQKSSSSKSSYKKSSSSHRSSRAKTVGPVHVHGYFRKNGTYVAPHYRSHPDGNFWNNWSTRGNINPFTGKLGTKDYPNGAWVGTRSSNSTYNTPFDGVTADYSAPSVVRVRTAEAWTGVPTGATLLQYSTPSQRTPVPITSWDQLSTDVMAAEHSVVTLHGKKVSGERFTADVAVLGAKNWSGLGVSVFANVDPDESSERGAGIGVASSLWPGKSIESIAIDQNAEPVSVDSWAAIVEFTTAHPQASYWVTVPDAGKVSVELTAFYLTKLGVTAPVAEVTPIGPVAGEEFDGVTTKEVEGKIVVILANADVAHLSVNDTVVAIRSQSERLFTLVTSHDDVNSFLKSHSEESEFIVMRNQISNDNVVRVTRRGELASASPTAPIEFIGFRIGDERNLPVPIGVDGDHRFHEGDTIIRVRADSQSRFTPVSNRKTFFQFVAKSSENRFYIKVLHSDDTVSTVAIECKPRS